jgi:hypothetical protein
MAWLARRRRRRIHIDAFAINPGTVAVCAAATLPLTTNVTSARDIALIGTLHEIYLDE